MGFPCGDCPSCRANRRRIWTHRMMLEAMMHEESAFLTLTYSDEYCPLDGSVDPSVLRLFLDRLRKRIYPRRFRYFAVGEYGDRSQRPHYHAALFGFGSCLGGIAIKGACQCENCLLVRETWGFGHVMLAELNIKTAQYVTGYVAKKLTKPSDLRLQGRHPEFARMSLRPGIGAAAIPDVASVMMRYKLEDRGDVPNALRHGKSELPLGRYLRRLLRKQVGLDENAPPEVLEALRQGLLPVYEAVEAAFPKARGGLKTLLLQDTAEKLNAQYGRNVSQRQRRRSSI